MAFHHRVIPVAMPLGFTDPVLESQKTFRALLMATSYPGRIVKVVPPTQCPQGLCEASWCVLLTLADHAVRLWTDLPKGSAVLASIKTFCGSTMVERPRDAELVMFTKPAEALSVYDFNLGTEDRPEQGATLLLQVDSLTEGDGFRLSGPGIYDKAFLKVAGVPESFWSWRRTLEKRYPLGVDLILTCGSFLAALPRTTHMGD
ncbi:MAG: phosphonate C-P lyase system protein PhnH [bacterium]